jgi:hypothetical protein
MTGHLDGTGLTGNLHKRNNQIRSHSQSLNANQKAYAAWYLLTSIAR